MVTSTTRRAAPPRRPARLHARQLRREARAAHLFLAPVMVLFSVFLVIPLVFAVVLSLSQWGGFDLARIEFVGLANFRRLLGPGSTFVSPVLVQTLQFFALSVGLTVVGALIVAQCIERVRFQGFWRLLFFLPVVANVVAIGNIWKGLYQPYGLINALLNKLGIRSVDFLTNTSLALPSVAVVYAWVSAGTAVLILTAGLKSIDVGIYEAAELDGANAWRMFWTITLPLLRPTLVFVFITQAISSMQSFALMIAMTQGGGPANATMVGALAMYQEAFQKGSYGTASAMAVALFLVIAVITALQLWLSRRGGEED
jgi:multiple sugar transport system permease protein